MASSKKPYTYPIILHNNYTYAGVIYARENSFALCAQQIRTCINERRPILYVRLNKHNY